MMLLKKISNLFGFAMLLAALGTVGFGDMQYEMGNYNFDQTANTLQAVYYLLAAMPSMVWLFVDERSK